MNMNKLVLSVALLVRFTLSQQCGPVEGIRLSPGSYSDPFKYACCAPECGDLCGMEQCSSISSEKCCGAYISRTCEVNGELLPGCIDAGFDTLPITYCDDTIDAPCYLTNQQYKDYGYERQDKKRFDIDQEDKLTTEEIVWICVGGFFFLALTCGFLGFCVKKYRYKEPAVEDKAQEEKEESKQDVEIEVQ